MQTYAQDDNRYRSLQLLLRDQEQMLMKLGLDPRNASEQDIIVALDKMDELPNQEHTCSLCLETVQEPFFPCRCLFFKVHRCCLPNASYICSRCKTPYGGAVHERVMGIVNDDMRCHALTVSGRRCFYAKRRTDMCHIHEKMQSRGRFVRRYNDAVANDPIEF